HGFAADGSVLRAAAPAIIVDAPGVQVTIERSIVGGVRLHEDCELRVEDSVIDATSADRVALCAPNGTGTSGSLTAVNTTIVGAVRTSLLRLASNCIFVAETPTGFTAPIRAERRQAGCVRFSWLPPGAIVPRRFRCVSSTKDASGDVRPRFASMRFGDPRYLMLVSACSPMIRTGADDGGEMGAMHQTFRPARIANLRARLDEQLRAGFAAGVIEST
ncbi:MAG: hypothetical protein SGJ11_07845, partial [Phycisphaerae bacterium]|nr:hypothetical protein [Phycisphaerae bacterium]